MHLAKLLGLALLTAIALADVANWVYSGVQYYQERQLAHQREAELHAIFDNMWARMNDGTIQVKTSETRHY